MFDSFLILYIAGVTTIAGGYSQKSGHADGPARDASFSDDFELTFISEMCALLISDHGNRLVRQISLRPEDCSRQSGSGENYRIFEVLCLVSLFLSRFFV